jgi:TatD DNase family protein
MTVARAASERGVFVVSVTNLPSHFERGFAYVRPLRSVRLALGLHPLTAESHAQELELFDRLLPLTSFVGEVGLDFSRHGKRTQEQQVHTLQHVLQKITQSSKMLTLHSRGAEPDVLRMLRDHGVKGAVFHWYTGPKGLLNQALADGHYFSVNPLMTLSKKGQEIISALPRERVLTESDGPYASVGGKPLHPWDVNLVELHLAGVWRISSADVERIVWANFKRLVAAL